MWYSSYEKRKIKKIQNAFIERLQDHVERNDITAVKNVIEKWAEFLNSKRIMEPEEVELEDLRL